MKNTNTEYQVWEVAKKGGKEVHREMIANFPTYKEAHDHAAHMILTTNIMRGNYIMGWEVEEVDIEKAREEEMRYAEDNYMRNNK